MSADRGSPGESAQSLSISTNRFPTWSICLTFSPCCLRLLFCCYPRSLLYLSSCSSHPRTYFLSGMASTSTTALATGSVIAITFLATLALVFAVALLVALLKARKRKSCNWVKRPSSLPTSSPSTFVSNARASLPPPPAIFKHWEALQSFPFLGRTPKGRFPSLSPLPLVLRIEADLIPLPFLFFSFLSSLTDPPLLPTINIHPPSLPTVPLSIEDTSAWDTSSSESWWNKHQYLWAQYPNVAKMVSATPTLSPPIADCSVVVDILPPSPEVSPRKTSDGDRKHERGEGLEGEVASLIETGRRMEQRDSARSLEAWWSSMVDGKYEVVLTVEEHREASLAALEGRKVEGKEEVVLTKEEHRAVALAALEGRTIAPCDDTVKETFEVATIERDDVCSSLGRQDILTTPQLRAILEHDDDDADDASSEVSSVDPYLFSRHIDAYLTDLEAEISLEPKDNTLHKADDDAATPESDDGGDPESDHESDSEDPFVFSHYLNE
jgi:hypothetical protein